MTGHPSGADPWRDAFRAELLSHGLSPGRASGALAEVDEYCADAGLTPQEAFGAAAGYARAYANDFADLPVDRPAPVSWRAGVRALPAVGGVSLLLGGVDAVSHGVAGRVTAGQVLSVLVCGLAAAVFVGLAQRGVAHLPWWLAAVVALGLTGAAYPQLRWTQPLLRPPGWLLLGTGVSLLVVAWWLVAGRSTGADPGTAAEAPGAGGAGAVVPGVGLRVARLVARWGVPVTLVVAVVLVALLPEAR